MYRFWKEVARACLTVFNMAVLGQQDREHHDKNNPLEIRITAF